MALAFQRVAPARRILTALVALLLVFSLLGGTVRPAYSAETVGQRTTRNIILGALAMTAGIILYNNYQHKVAYAHSVVGYTRDGGVVYGDGRIVYPNGTTIYTSNNGRTVCSFDGYGQRCQTYNLAGYYPQGYNNRYYNQYYNRENDDENDNGDDGD